MSAAPHLLVYDIPSKSKIPNPTTWLRRIAVRINKSVWVVQHDLIPYRELQNLENAGAKWFTLPFDTRAMGDIVELVTASVISDIRATVQRANESCDRATLAAQRSKKTLTERIALHRKKTAPIIKKMGRILQSVREAARTFGVTPDAIGYAQAASNVVGLRQAMLEKARIMMESAREIEMRNPGSPMAKAIRAGTIPDYIVADYLGDMGSKQEEKLRKVIIKWD